MRPAYRALTIKLTRYLGEFCLLATRLPAVLQVRNYFTLLHMSVATIIPVKCCQRQLLHIVK